MDTVDPLERLGQVRDELLVWKLHHLPTGFADSRIE
jgi:hypothetical protein